MAVAPARQFGDERAGFSLELNGTIVRTQGWGFWSSDLALTFCRETLEACKLAKGPFTLVVDFASVKPQGDEGQAAIRDFIASAAGLGPRHALFIAAEAVTKMQLMRLVREAGAEWQCYDSAADAAAALNSAP